MSNAREKNNPAEQPAKGDSNQMEIWLADGRQMLGFDQIKADINKIRFDAQTKEILAAFLDKGSQQPE